VAVLFSGTVALSRTFDDRYAGAVRELSTLRRALLDAGRREQWESASAMLIGEDFCSAVESGRFAERSAEWR